MSVLKVGPLVFRNNLMLAPMAGFTNLPFRMICREMGAGLVFSEMISAEALVRKNGRTRAMLDTLPAEDLLGVQICGGRKETLREAVLILQESGVKLIDLNLGCPVPKIVKSGAGAALLRNPPLIKEILEEMVKVAVVPITVKLRKGWDERSVNCLDVCRTAEDCGVSLITLHGRTARQGYTGRADWTILRAVSRIIAIPLIGNGDVREPEDVKRLMEETGCAGVMIGRGSLGNPWIFKRILGFLETGEIPPVPSGKELLAVMHRHLGLAVEQFGEYRGIRFMRKFWGHYVKERPGSAKLRGRLVAMTDIESLRKALIEGVSQGREKDWENLEQLSFVRVEREICGRVTG